MSPLLAEAGAESVSLWLLTDDEPTRAFLGSSGFGPDGAFRDRLKAQARAEGFVAMGICAPDAIPQAPERLARWLMAEERTFDGVASVHACKRKEPSAGQNGTCSTISSP